MITDKKAACAAVGGLMRGIRSWTAQLECEAACCTDDDCNKDTIPSGTLHTVRGSLWASFLGRSGGGAGKGRRACDYVSGIWIPPPISLWLPVDWAVRFPPISAKRKLARMCANVNKHWKTRAKKAAEVITSLLMSSPPISFLHRLFRCRYSNFRDVVASSPSFSRPAARAPRRACSQARLEGDRL